MTLNPDKKVLIPLTLEERIFIQEHIKKGFSLSETARVMGRGKNTVVTEVRNNGGIYLYNAKQAQEAAYVNRIQGDLKRKAVLSKSPNPYLSLKQRLDAMEMQMEILIETIKDLKNQN